MPDKLLKLLEGFRFKRQVGATKQNLLLEPVNWAREIRLVSEEDESP